MLHLQRHRLGFQTRSGRPLRLRPDLSLRLPGNKGPGGPHRCPAPLQQPWPAQPCLLRLHPSGRSSARRRQQPSVQAGLGSFRQVRRPSDRLAGTNRSQRQRQNPSGGRRGQPVHRTRPDHVLHSGCRLAGPSTGGVFAGQPCFLRRAVRSSAQRPGAHPGRPGQPQYHSLGAREAVPGDKPPVQS